MINSYRINFSFLILFFGTFPFLRLFPIESRVQPIVVIISILLFLFRKQNLKIYFIENRILIILIIFLTIYGALCLGSFGFKNVIIEYIGLISGPILFICITSIQSLKVINFYAFKLSVIILCLFGILEISPLKTKVFPILNHIIPLNEPTIPSSLFGLRGLSYAAPEQSNAAFIIFLLLCLFQIFKFLKYKLSKSWEIILIILAIFNKSGTMFLFLSIYFYFFYVLNNKKLRKNVIIFSLSFLFFILIWFRVSLLTDFQNNRMLQVADRFTELVYSGGIYSSENWFLISGPRFAEVATGYKSIIHNIFGFGVGSVENGFSDIISTVKIDFGGYWNKKLIDGFFDNSKPNSYLSYLSCSSGVLGLILILAFKVYLYKRIRRINEIDHYKLCNSIFWISTFIIAFRSTATIPIAWILLALIFKINKNINESSTPIS